MPYLIETRDRNERWHRPRIGRFTSFAAACAAAAAVSGITAWRIVNVETGRVEYLETIPY